MSKIEKFTGTPPKRNRIQCRLDMFLGAYKHPFRSSAPPVYLAVKSDFFKGVAISGYWGIWWKIVDFLKIGKSEDAVSVKIGSAVKF